MVLGRKWIWPSILECRLLQTTMRWEFLSARADFAAIHLQNKAVGSKYKISLVADLALFHR